MVPALLGVKQASVPPPSYHRTMATALHLDALTLVTPLQLLEVCRIAVKLAHQQVPPAAAGGSWWSAASVYRGLSVAAGPPANALALVLSRGP
jgi:hypothetical protein